MSKKNNFTLNVRGRLLDLAVPQVMGILNVTPDSFYAGSRVQTAEAVAARAREIVAQGGSIIDVGACSTRPGGTPVDQDEEMRRLRMALPVVAEAAPGAVVSVDTFRPDVAKMAVEEYGAAIINDVSEAADDRMIPLMGRLKAAYVLMSVEASLHDMLIRFAREVELLHEADVADVILDPGFGFGKTMADNYRLLAAMDRLQVMELPLLVGVSRKRMVHQLLGVAPDSGEALTGTTVVNTIALERGADILRVHDVKAAADAVKIVSQLNP